MFFFGSKTPQVSVEDVYQSLNRRDILMLDVRTVQEFSSGKIKGSINLPVDELAGRVQQAIPQKDQTIYVYCRSGSRSARAVDIMKKLGYANVFNMDGGILMWQAKKLPWVK